MSELKLRPFEEQLANVIYTNRLRRAEEKGMEEKDLQIERLIKELKEYKK